MVLIRDLNLSIFLIQSLKVKFLNWCISFKLNPQIHHSRVSAEILLLYDTDTDTASSSHTI